MSKDNIGVVQRYNVDKKVGITFNQIIDADGETIIAEVYFIGGSLVAVVNASGFSTTGGLKDQAKTVTCDFSAIPVGDGYSLVFRTAASGVLAKAGLVIFAEDAFSTVALSGAVPDGDGSIFQPQDDDLTAIANLSPSEGDYLIYGTEWGLENVGDDTRFNTDLAISQRGIYIFYGSVSRTVTFADAISGDVVIITEATAQLNFAGNFHPNFRGYMRANTVRMTFRWNGINQYNF